MSKIIGLIEERVLDYQNQLNDELRWDKKINILESVKCELLYIYEASILVEHGGELNYTADESSIMLKWYNTITKEDALEVRKYVSEIVSSEVINKAISLAQRDLKEDSYLGSIKYFFNDSNEKESIKNIFKNTIILHRDKYEPIMYYGIYEKKEYIELATRVVGKQLFDRVVNELENKLNHKLKTSLL